MQTKLTLRLDSELIERAKAWARANDTSLSEAVAQFFSALPQSNAEPDLSKLSPWARSLYGVAKPADGSNPTDEELLQEYIDYLEEKYR